MTFYTNQSELTSSEYVVGTVNTQIKLIICLSADICQGGEGLIMVITIENYT